jgi:hypothetical protein
MASDWQRHFLNSSPELLHLKSLHLAEMFIWESSRIYVTFQNDFDIQDGHPYLIGRNMLNPPLPFSTKGLIGFCNTPKVTPLL